MTILKQINIYCIDIKYYCLSIFNNTNYGGLGLLAVELWLFTLNLIDLKVDKL